MCSSSWMSAGRGGLCWTIAAVLTATVFCLPAQAREQSSDKAAEASVRATLDSYIAAFNRGDAKAVAEHWGSGGVWIGPAGRRAQGRVAIQKELEAFFADNKGVRIDDPDVSIRLIAPDAAVEEGSVRITRPGAAPERSPYMAVHVRKDGQWQLDSVRELQQSDSPPVHENLKQLGWMVGDWIDSSPDSDVETSVAWSKNKAFLTCNFRISARGTEPLEGTQTIAWDASAGVIRSWIFDSDGGFGEGIWTRKDNRWIVKFKQVLADGRKASATNVYTLIDGNRYGWQSIGRQVDGKFLPNIAPVTVVRKSAKIQPDAATEKVAPKAKP